MPLEEFAKRIPDLKDAEEEARRQDPVAAGTPGRLLSSPLLIIADKPKVEATSILQRLEQVLEDLEFLTELFGHQLGQANVARTPNALHSAGVNVRCAEV